MRRSIVGALVLVTVAAVLGATVFREPIAAAAEKITPTFVTNDAAHPVPVHEQGTANVNVTNSSVAVAAPAPITHGGLAEQWVCGNTVTPTDAVATALSIHMTSGVFAVQFYLGTPANTAATFMGPEEAGPSDVQLALNRPIKFDHIECIGVPGTGRVSVSWVGNLP